MNAQFRGIIPPVVTPLVNDYELDVPGLEKLIEYLIDGGVHGLFFLGTTGEAASLSLNLRQKLVEVAGAIINKRIPWVVGITDTCTGHSLELAKTSETAGADALVISAPYYLPMAQHEFIDYLAFLGPKLPLPYLLYNMPGCTKFHMKVETVERAKELGAAGIKDSSGDLGYLYELLEAFKTCSDFSVLSGTELFIPETMIFGGNGGVAGGANLFPRLFVRLYEAAVVKDLEKIYRLRKILLQIDKKIYNICPDDSKYIKTIKSALSAMGICSNYVAQPFRPSPNEQQEQMKANIRELGTLFPEIQEELNHLRISV